MAGEVENALAPELAWGRGPGSAIYQLDDLLGGLSHSESECPHANGDPGQRESRPRTAGNRAPGKRGAEQTAGGTSNARFSVSRLLFSLGPSLPVSKVTSQMNFGE